jgi:hypothetical protein
VSRPKCFALGCSKHPYIGRWYCSEHEIEASKRDPEIRALLRARNRRYDRTVRYGLSSEDQVRLLADPVCAICKIPLVETKGKRDSLCIDHDHATGNIRGLLCPAHNKGLGHLEKHLIPYWNEVQKYLRSSYMREDSSEVEFRAPEECPVKGYEAIKGPSVWSPKP